jgi:serine/threonine-protein phosphatase 2B catalytic subunit
LFVGRRKYSDVVYEAALESFNALPLAAVVDGTLFCVHGGLSPHMDTINDIQAVRSSPITPLSL